MFYFLHTHTKTKTKKSSIYINETAVVFSDCGRFIMNSVLVGSLANQSVLPSELHLGCGNPAHQEVRACAQYLLRY